VLAAGEPAIPARTPVAAPWRRGRAGRRRAPSSRVGSIAGVTPATEADDARMTVLVYSDDVDTRTRVKMAIGRRPAPDVPRVEWLECATAAAVISALDKGGVDLAILDGEATPVGGMGIARQAKDEIFQCPPIVVLTGRVADNWLANWSRAEAAVAHPLDPIVLARTVADLLRRRRAELTTS
jgi:DNA-binding response OmpR family regulator